MAKFISGFLDTIDTFLAWASSSLKQTTESYCEIETADSPTTLVAYDGSLASVIRIDGITTLLGVPEFERLHEGLTLAFQAAMKQSGRSLQVLFNYDKDRIGHEITEIFAPARATSKRLALDLDDLFDERVRYLSNYCGFENVFFVLWTRPELLPAEQVKQSGKDKIKFMKEKKVPPFRRTQNLMAAMTELRDGHEAFVRAIINDLEIQNLRANLLEAHEAIYEMRMSADPEFTDPSWRPVLPGDEFLVQSRQHDVGSYSDLLWPSLAKQILPRDAENLDMRTVRIGDKIYSSVFIDLFPKDIKIFMQLLQRTLSANIPWRISFLVDGNALSSMNWKAAITAILSFSSTQNRLMGDATKLLTYLDTNTDNAIVRLRVAACTWAPEGSMQLLRTRTSELAKAIEGWGTCEVSEICGDAFAGVVSSMLGVTSSSVATAALAPLCDVIGMLPITRPASPWKYGALLFRTPDGKPWPFQPGSSEQTTWIDLLYARPGSGKSVLSNAINLGLCLSGGLQRLPRIAIIDIGPSSSGLISLLKEALPQESTTFGGVSSIAHDARLFN